MKKANSINVQKPFKSRYNDDKGKEIKALATANLAKISLIASNYKNMPAQIDTLSKPNNIKYTRKSTQLDLAPCLTSPDATNKSVNNSDKQPLTKKPFSNISKSAIIAKK